MRVICKISDIESYTERVLHMLVKMTRNSKAVRWHFKSFSKCFLDNDLRSPQGLDVAQ